MKLWYVFYGKENSNVTESAWGGGGRYIKWDNLGGFFEEAIFELKWEWKEVFGCGIFREGFSERIESVYR